MKRTLGILLILASALAAACGSDDGDSSSTPTSTPGTGAFPLTITQTDGERLTLESAPQRIVSLAANATEILCTIDAGDRLVAVENFENCPAGSTSKPTVDAYQPNLEAIAAFNPDLVFTTYDPGGFVESLRRINVPVLYLDVPTTIDGVYENIELFGDIVDKRTEADSLVKAMKDRQTAVLGKLNNVTGPRVYHELDITYYSAAPQSFVGDFYRLLKASNIAEGATTDYPQLSAEIIIERNPEVIVLANEAAGVTPEVVKQRAGWDVIDAVQNDRICGVDPDIISRPGPRVVDALEDLAECLYPEIF